MPIYEYECSQCHETSDALQKLNDPAPETCPRCGAHGTLSRKLSRTSFVLKGGGWYADLYSSSKPKADGSEAKPAAKTDSPGGGGDSAPASGGDGGGGGGSGSGSGSGSSSSGSSGSSSSSGSSGSSSSSGSSGSGPGNSSPKVAAAKA